MKKVLILSKGSKKDEGVGVRTGGAHNWTAIAPFGKDGKLTLRMMSVAFALGVCSFGPTNAQPSEPSMSPFTRTGKEDTVQPLTATVFGGSEQTARDMLVSMRLRQRENDLCSEVGCLIIANESDRYKVTGFFIQSGTSPDRMSWGRNQMDRPLLAKRATYRFKLKNETGCEFPVRFVLNGYREKLEPVSVDGQINFCRSPGVHSLVRLRVVVPSVEVREEGLG